MLKSENAPKFESCKKNNMGLTHRHENGDEFGNRNIGRSPMFEAAGRNDFFEFRTQLFEFSNRNSGKNWKIFMPAGCDLPVWPRADVHVFGAWDHP